MRKIITGVVTLSLCIVLLSGCNTVKGMGQDVSKGGHEIQRAVN